ncbi:MAG: hypothetical protein JWO06_3465 [Bacteroidota bacterium]|nr:hypothetical protein [Bacteroidota bacterium]
MKFIPLLLLILITSCSTGKKGKNVPQKEHEIPLDLPPTAPIPPENYCYELHQGEKATKLLLTITGDSVFGKIDYHINPTILAQGTISGIIYGNTLLVTYTEGTGPQEEQEWKMDEDSIYKKQIDTSPNDSTHHLIKYPERGIFTTAMHKVACSN